MAVVRVIACVWLAACVGSVPGGGSGGTSDANADAPKLMWPDGGSGSGTMLPCKNMATPPGDGHHNPGKSCFQSCHNHGFTLAGTLYTNATGNTAFAGATISITDNNGTVVDLVTNLNGNFYTSTTLALPVLVMASSCPSAVRMTLASTTGDCNSCHVGATNNQMHLP
jgi:hypothetical protein